MEEMKSTSHSNSMPKRPSTGQIYLETQPGSPGLCSGIGKTEEGCENPEIKSTAHTVVKEGQRTTKLEESKTSEI